MQTTVTYPPRNLERIKATLDKIKADPSCWGQAQWHCDTAHCFGGHGQLAMGVAPNSKTARADAREWFSLTKAEADYYFFPSRTIKQLEELLEPLDGQGRDRDGRDHDGMAAYFSACKVA